MPLSKVPKKEIVKFIIKEALQKQKISSQNELAEVVAEKLRRGDRKYSITGKRARIIALEIPVKVSIKTRRGQAPKRCPSCSYGLRRTYSKNLFGKKLLSGLRCQKCGYKGSEGRWIPSRYEFEKV